MLRRVRPAMDSKKRFMDKVSPEPMSGCWLWTASVNRGGYGRFGRAMIDGGIPAHRASWFLFRGSVPPNTCVLHKCDVRCCVNPDHLFLGTLADNNADKTKKGRQARGITHMAAKLTVEQVLEIRAIAVRGQYGALGRRFGVGKAAIRSIVLGVTWRHV